MKINLYPRNPICIQADAKLAQSKSEMFYANSILFLWCIVLYWSGKGVYGVPRLNHEIPYAQLGGKLYFDSAL